MPIYQDYIGKTFDTLDELAEYRIRVQAPLLDGAVCPATEYTFAVSNDDGRSWHNPDLNTKESLTLSVARQEGCCRNLGDGCPTAIQAKHMP